MTKRTEQGEPMRYDEPRPVYFPAEVVTEKPRILQLHHQSIDNLKKTVLVAQGEPPYGRENQFITNWIADMSTRHPLPSRHQWLVVSEDSEHFERTPHV